MHFPLGLDFLFCHKLVVSCWSFGVQAKLEVGIPCFFFQGSLGICLRFEIDLCRSYCLFPDLGLNWISLGTFVVPFHLQIGPRPLNDGKQSYKSAPP